MKTIYYVRHGESEGNAAGLLMGGSNDLPLTAKGEKQALQAAKGLAGKRIDTVAASPLKRAYHTAEIIAKQIGFTGKIATTPLLKERDFGSASGQPREKAYDMLDNNLAEGAETHQQFYDRMAQALDWLRALPCDNILLVGHSAAAKMMLAVLNGTPAKDFLNNTHLDHADVLELRV